MTKENGMHPLAKLAEFDIIWAEIDQFDAAQGIRSSHHFRRKDDGRLSQTNQEN